MPEFVIDGKSREYEDGELLLQHCLDHDIEIPYFCYHPAMSVPTNCRMCLVEVGYPVKNRETGELERDENGEVKVNWGRKPATACNQPISPDMIVKTHRTSDTVRKMQSGVLEYMLVNHPLDCPICDQAGECPLQIWTYKYGPEGSRFEDQKVHKPKRVELGPNVVLDAERCINCTRCTRFTEEISGSWQLTIVGRGDKNYPQTAPGETFDDPYSMNTIDLCPVGALTSDQFRFKARAWEMAHTPGVCTSCAKGCNIDLWVRDNQVLRLTPGENKEVNDYWMCDEGRLNIDKYNKDRVSGAKLKGDIPAEIDAAVLRLGKILKAVENTSKVMIIGSARASLESNYTLKKFASELGVKDISYVPEIQEGWGDELLRKDDRTPNAAACDLLGFSKTSIEDIRNALKGGSVELLYIMEDDRLINELGADLEDITVISHSRNYGPHHDKVDIVLPAATEIESESTFINADGIPQVTKMAKEIKKMTPEKWMRLSKSRLDKAAVAVDKWRDLDNVYDVLPSWEMLSMLSGEMNFGIKYKTHQDVFGKMKSEFDVLRDVNVSYNVPKRAFKISQFDHAIR